jgi:hypothetical protein
MARPIRVTVMALCVYLFSAMSYVGGLFAYVSPSADGGRHWFLSVALLITSWLGIRAGHYMIAQRAEAPRATIAFTIAGVLIPISLYFTVSQDRRVDVILPAIVGLAVFAACGWLAAGIVRGPNDGAA